MGTNPLNFFKQFQNMQSKINEMQDRIKDLKMVGYAGGDMVQIEINGHMAVTSVHISPEVVNPNEIGMLEDLILAAFTDAVNKMKEKLKDEFSFLTGGMDIPPGFMGM